MDIIEYDTSDSDYEEIDINNKINIQITTKSIKSIYYEYLQNNNLIFLHDLGKRKNLHKTIIMNRFLKTINEGLIISNCVIYKLSSFELNNKNSLYCENSLYECIDGQTRLLTLKYYISSELEYKNIYWKNKNERIFYNMNKNELKKLNNNSNIIYRNLTQEEKIKFDNFQMCFHIIETNEPLDPKIKCAIFNRMHNSERHRIPCGSYFRDNISRKNNIILTTIYSNKLLDKMNELKFFDKIKNLDQELFQQNFLIRIFLICGHRSLNYINYNEDIIQNLEENNGIGTSNVQLDKKDIKIILPKVIEIIEFIATNKLINNILPELAYIYILIYIRYGITEVINLIEYFTINKLEFNHYNLIKRYQEKVINSSILDNIYEKIKCDILKQKSTKCEIAEIELALDKYNDY